MNNDSLRKQLSTPELHPHQVDFINNILSSQKPLRALLVSPVGMGKSIAAASVIRELEMEESDKIRCLIVVPSAMQMQWFEIISQYANSNVDIIDAPAYRRLQMKSKPDENPWINPYCYVTSIDFLKIGNRINEVLELKWDMIVIDEAHHCTLSSQRGHVAQSIWVSNNVDIGIAITSTFSDQLDWLIKQRNTRIIRWGYNVLRVLDNNHLIPKREIEFVRFTPSLNERAFYKKLLDLFNSIELKDDVSSFLKENLLQRYASSLYAIEQSLTRYASKSVENITIDTDSPDELSTFEGILKVDEKIPYIFSKEIYRNLIDFLEQINIDSKWEACKKLLLDLKSHDPNNIIIFTEYTDTADYISHLLSDEGWPIYKVTSRQSVMKRMKNIEEAKKNPGILIMTSAITEGVDLTFSNQIIHYDLPYNPRRLLHRFTRVERFGSKFPVIYNYMLVDDMSITNDLFTKIEKNVSEIEQILSDGDK